MNLLKKFIGFVKNLSLRKKVILVVILVILGYFAYTRFTSSSAQPTYQTAQVTKGTLVVALTETGSVAVSNKVSVVTQASGIVSKVYVKSGQQVKAGDKIADVTLDTAGQQRQAQAYSSLLSAENNLNSAKAQLYTLQNQEFVANQKFVNDKGIANPTQQDMQDPVYIEEQAAWLAAEAAYKNQQNVISQSEANVSNANLAYQLTSGTIVAPTAGTISDLLITQGMQIGSSNTSAGSSTNTSNQTVAAIQTGNATTVQVSVSEVDAPQIKVGQEATITFDALPNKTFTGKVLGIDTTGSVSSGVVTYPAIIQLDESESDVLPNMSATASIITKVDNNVLLVPSSAIQTVGNSSTVRVLQNGKVTTVSVGTGDSSDSQTVITSGVTQGETVVTGQASTTSSGGSSPFSATRGGGAGGGAGRAILFRGG